MKNGALLAWGSAQAFFVVGVLVAVTFGILSNEIGQKLGLATSQIGLLGGIFLISYALSQLVLGIAISRVPARWVLAPTCFLAAVGTFLFSLSTSFALAAISQALIGLGLGSTFVGVIYLVGTRYGSNFAFMSSLSQSLANVFAAALSITSAFLPILVDFRLPFRILAILFLLTSLALLIWVKDRPDTSQGKGPSIMEGLKQAFASGQFWAAVVFYSGTFGTLLAFANLWNIQFQLNYFGHSVQQAAVMNSMISVGATFGGLAAGAWAARCGFVLPARVFVLLALGCFAVLLAVPLPVVVAGVVIFLIGVGFGCSTLGLAALQQHLSPAAASIATSVVVTVAYVFGGFIQPMVGVVLGMPQHSAALLNMLFSKNPEFHTYQTGLLLMAAAVLIAAAAAFFFKRQPPPAA